MARDYEKPRMRTAEVADVDADRGTSSDWGDDWKNRRVLKTGNLTGNHVRNAAGEDLGKIEDIMLDVPTGRIAYAVLSFGGFLGIGSKLFAVPWEALRLDRRNDEFVLDVDRQRLENAPGFDKDNWPDMAEPTFGRLIYEYYGVKPYWEGRGTDQPGTRRMTGGGSYEP
jgi:sporulation protein YlmC with PRC-barrel domain